MSSKVGQVNGSSKDNSCRVERTSNTTVEEAGEGVVCRCNEGSRLPYSHPLSVQFLSQSCVRSSTRRSIRITLEEASDLLELDV